MDFWGSAPASDPAAVESALRDAGEKLALRVTAGLQGTGE
jgi:hypothetical protein